MEDGGLPKPKIGKWHLVEMTQNLALGNQDDLRVSHGSVGWLTTASGADISIQKAQKGTKVNKKRRKKMLVLGNICNAALLASGNITEHGTNRKDRN